MSRLVVVADRERGEHARQVLAEAGLEADVFVVDEDMPDSSAEAVAEYRTAMQRLAVAGTLAAGAAHDISNLVIALELYMRAPDRASSRIDVPGALRRIRAIASSLTAFARAPRPATVCDLTTVADDAADLVELVLPNNASVVRLLEPAGRALVMASDSCLLQVVVNLLLNATQAVRGVDRGIVSIRTRAGTSDVALAVVDNGPGMSEDTVARAFRPFVTTRSEGSGLGLFICRHLVTSAGGAIDIDSEPGHGTTVTVTLPRVAAPRQTT